MSQPFKKKNTDPVEESLVPALKCQGCELSIKNGKIHKNFKDCHEALKDKVAEQGSLLKKAAESIKDNARASKMLWLILQGADDKCVSFTSAELASVPATATVRVLPCSTGVIASAK